MVLPFYGGIHPQNSSSVFIIYWAYFPLCIGIFGRLPPVMHDSGKKVSVIITHTLSTKSLYKLRSLPTCTYLPWQTVSVQAKRFLLRHSQMPKDKNYSISKVADHSSQTENKNVLDSLCKQIVKCCPMLTSH